MRNPRFTAQYAPDPVAAMEVISCRADSVAEEVMPLYAEELKVHKFHASSDLATGICAYMHDPRTNPFDVAPSLALVIRNAAAEIHANALFFPIVEMQSLCQHRSSKITDENGVPVGEVQSSVVDCGSAPWVNMEALLFAASGELLWWSDATPSPDVHKRNDVDLAFMRLVATVPARFVEIAPPSPSPAQAPAPAPAADAPAPASASSP
jgi:hypothetical protein